MKFWAFETPMKPYYDTYNGDWVVGGKVENDVGVIESVNLRFEKEDDLNTFIKTQSLKMEPEVFNDMDWSFKETLH